MLRSSEREPQLLGNILFILEEAKVIKGFNVANSLEEVTDFMKGAISKADPTTILSFVNGQTEEHMEMALSDIAIGKDGKPLFAVTTVEMPYAGLMEKFAICGWMTKAGYIYSAFSPRIAFCLPDEP